jgi:trans-aconitate 2-methyltransferase
MKPVRLRKPTGQNAGSVSLPRIPAKARPLHKWDAGRYESLPLPHVEWGKRVVGRLDLTGDEHVVEAGAGTGRDAELVLERIPRGHYTAIDGSNDMLGVLRQRLGPYGNRVTVIEADLNKPLALMRPADAIFSIATFHWLLDHDRLFANLATALRPGGQLVFECGGWGNVAMINAAINEVFGQAPRPWNFRGPEETRDALLRAGFAQVEARLRPHPVTFAGRSAFMRYLDTTGIAYAAAGSDPAARAAFVRAVAARLSKPMFDHVRLEVTARLSTTVFQS